MIQPLKLRLTKSELKLHKGANKTISQSKQPHRHPRISSETHVSLSSEREQGKIHHHPHDTGRQRRQAVDTPKLERWQFPQQKIVAFASEVALTLSYALHWRPYIVVSEKRIQ
ncbi:hypothetical protein CDAR_560341 [Caerostris darwini]|uniref:Uncharacterized protein n=1 Tax=Caerostris darwini TaxID=1538125 RepID=A0AAV4VZ76_9ARAC|nr:hypothetical protein CDAR_560081 [Caerostris darwini]GIY75667.1 hypothetical protein CDAR_560341 [Caerostris darwini]